MTAGDLKIGAAEPAVESSASSPADGGPQQKPAAGVAPTNPPAPPENGRMILTHESRIAGTRLEIDPVFGSDGWTINMNVTLEHHFAPPTLRTVSPPPGNGMFRIDLPATDFHATTINTAITLESGMTKLLGIWTPKDAPEFEGKDVMQAAFLRAERILLWE
jgi:hypothetical protein